MQCSSSAGVVPIDQWFLRYKYETGGNYHKEIRYPPANCSNGIRLHVYSNICADTYIENKPRKYVINKTYVIINTIMY